MMTLLPSTSINLSGEPLRQISELLSFTLTVTSIVRTGLAHQSRYCLTVCNKWL